MLPGGSGEKGIGGGGNRVRLMNVNTERLSGLKYKLVCYFKLVATWYRGICV